MIISYIEFRAMGCQITIQLETEADGNAILNRIPAQIEALEARLSRFRPNSELMSLNARAGEWVAVSSVLLDNIHSAKHAAQLTEGLYNPLILRAMVANGYDRSFERINHPSIAKRAPAPDWQTIDLRLKSREVRLPEGSAIDLGGIAKGWTAETLANDLCAYGSCLVNMGGDMVARGAPAGFPGWPIEIEDPLNGDVFTTLSLCDAAAATSGTDYRRWQTGDGRICHHIIDPRTGESAETDVLTATLIHEHATTAEAYAKAVLLRGACAGLAWLNNQWQTAGLVFQHDGSALSTSTFTRFMDQRTIS
jgi:thiamine biosynthesis lipoprotein